MIKNEYEFESVQFKLVSHEPEITGKAGIVDPRYYIQIGNSCGYDRIDVTQEEFQNLLALLVDGQ